MEEKKAIRLAGKPVAEAINVKTAAAAAELRRGGIEPTLAILRVGERESDLSYERGAVRCCESVGITVRRALLPAETTQQALMAALETLNREESVHGILVFLPLPRGLDGEAVRAALRPEKDVDGVTGGSLAGVFTGGGAGFAPCTAQAALEILDYYGVDCAGKRAVVIGRSLVVGRPAAMLLLERNATVTLCHSHSHDIPALTRAADIVLVAAGQREAFGSAYFAPGQVVVDVGIHWNESTGKLCGDVCYEEAAAVAAAVTPVPGGVGAVTSAVLAAHVVRAAQKRK